jgi:hypothetical protein
MRFLTLLTAAQMLLTVGSAWSEPSAGKVVELLKDVCVAPATPEAMLEAGGKLASAAGWKLLRSEPTPLPMIHNEHGPKISFTSVWEVDLPEGQQVKLAVSILRPEIPGVKHSICLIQPKLDIERDGLTKAVEEQFGPVVTRDMSGRFRDGVYWHFTEEKAVENCGKQVVILDHRETPDWGTRALIFTDFAYPDEPGWKNMWIGAAVCRS